MRERRPRGRRDRVPGELRDARHGADAEADARADGLRRREGDARPSRARATSSGCRRSTSAPTSTGATSSATCCGSSSTCSARSRRRLDVIHHVLRSVRGARGVPALAGVVVGDGPRGGLADRQEAPAHHARRSSSIAIRGTVKGLKLFISLFTGHEPDISENAVAVPRLAHRRHLGDRRSTRWCCRRSTWRTPSSSRCRSRYKDVSPESVIRIHEIIQMEKPANTQYYLRFAVRGRRRRAARVLRHRRRRHRRHRPRRRR